MLILHPLWASIGRFYEFHKAHPRIPIIFLSGVVSGEEQVEEFLFRDADGVYIAETSNPLDFSNFIPHILKEERSYIVE